MKMCDESEQWDVFSFDIGTEWEGTTAHFGSVSSSLKCR